MKSTDLKLAATSFSQPHGGLSELGEAEIVDIPFLGALAGCSARRSERRVASHTSEEQRRNAPAGAAKNGILAFSASLGLPRDAEGPVFKEPWEAQAFAMTLALHERGVFTWSEWAVVLAQAIRDAQAAGDPDTGENYYRHWLVALERITTDKGLVSGTMLAVRKQAWADAAHRTPHGRPIAL